MKYTNLCAWLCGFVAAASLSACDMNEEPKSQASVDMIFSSETGLKTYSYSFYEALPGTEARVSGDKVSDYGLVNILNAWECGAYTTNSSTSWSWTALRNINFFLEHNVDGRVSEKTRNHYNGIARFFRARFYFERMKTYGELPWIDKVFNESNDPALLAPRDTRDVIIRNIIADLDFAAANITTTGITHLSTTINRWTALGLKSRVCLFEAAWRKYHANDEFDFARTGCTEYSADDLYRLAADAALEIMDDGPYSLYTGTAYDGHSRGSYRQVFQADDAVTQESMLSFQQDGELVVGMNNYYFANPNLSYRFSFSRKFMMSYLNRDGSPYEELDADGKTKSFLEETSNRDLRLNQTVRCADYTTTGMDGEKTTDCMPLIAQLSLSGYECIKYIVDDQRLDSKSSNKNDVPWMRFAEILLNYAEAKAELGELTDNDWARTVGALRSRAGITGGTTATGTLTAAPAGTPDPYIAAYYPGITDPKILEIRRDRTIELVCEGFRMTDLQRWKMGELYVNDPWEGIYFTKLKSPIDLNADGINDVYFYETSSLSSSEKKYAAIAVNLRGSNTNFLVKKAVPGGFVVDYTISGRAYPERQYLHPIPEIVRQKNPNLTQNPGWE